MRTRLESKIKEEILSAPSSKDAKKNRKKNGHFQEIPSKTRIAGKIWLKIGM
jgi:hypothetical protein